MFGGPSTIEELSVDKNGDLVAQFKSEGFVN